MGWSSVPVVSRGVYHGRSDHTLKVERVGSRRDVGKYSFANKTGVELSFSGIGGVGKEGAF
jgi:hypothetical protein